MTETRPIESGTDIPDHWFEMLFDGRLWAVKMADLPPFEELHHFRQLVIRRGHKLQYDYTSVRFTTDGTIAYVQTTSDRHGKNRRDRAPVDTAIAAPPPPPVPRYLDPKIPKPPPAASFADSIQRMMEAHLEAGLPDVPPSHLTHHPELFYLAAACTCGTNNFRAHPTRCPAYSLLGMVEIQLRKMDEAPEVWGSRYHSS